MAAQILIHHRLEHLSESRHGHWPRRAIGGAHPVTLGIRQGALQFGALDGQVQVPLALVLFADPAFDQTILDQRPQHAVERLLGHPEDRQKIVHGRAGAAVDKVDRPVVRAAIFHVGQNPVRIGCKPPIGKEHRLDAFPKLLVRQEKKGLAALAHRIIRH